MSDSEPDFTSRFHPLQPSPCKAAGAAQLTVAPFQPADAAQLALVSAGEVVATQRPRKRAVDALPAVQASKAREAKARIATARLKKKVHVANHRIAKTLTTSCVLRCRVRVKVNKTGTNYSCAPQGAAMESIFDWRTAPSWTCPSRLAARHLSASSSLATARLLLGRVQPSQASVMTCSPRRCGHRSAASWLRLPMMMVFSHASRTYASTRRRRQCPSSSPIWCLLLKVVRRGMCLWFGEACPFA